MQTWAQDQLTFRSDLAKGQHRWREPKDAVNELNMFLDPTWLVAHSTTAKP